MHLSQFHYLPLTPGFFSILVAVFVGLLVILIALGVLRHAYLSLGVRPGTAMLLLLGSLIGSYFNIPIAALPPEQVESDKVIEFFGMEYTVPVVQNLPGTGQDKKTLTVYCNFCHEYQQIFRNHYDEAGWSKDRRVDIRAL